MVLITECQPGANSSVYTVDTLLDVYGMFLFVCLLFKWKVYTVEVS